MNIKILNVLLIISMLVISFGITPVHAQEERVGDPASPELTIAPSILELEADRNETIQSFISISTNSSLPIPVTVNTIDYSVDQKGYPTYETDFSPWSAKSWITAYPADFILLTDEPREIEITIKIPEFAEYGSHVATLLFQPVLPSEYFDPHSAHVIPYVGAIIAINIVEPQSKPSLDYLSISGFQPHVEEDHTISLQATIHNRDIYYHRVTGNLEFRPILTFIGQKVSLDGITVMPRTAREVQNTFEEELNYGVYLATFRVSDKNDTSTVTRLYMHLAPYHTVLAALLIIVLSIIYSKRYAFRKPLSKAIFS